MTTENTQPFGIVGMAVAACVACCAAPILGFIAASGMLTATGFVLFGTVGLLIAVPATALIVRRRRQLSACTPASEPVAVAAPTRRE